MIQSIFSLALTLVFIIATPTESQADNLNNLKRRLSYRQLSYIPTGQILLKSYIQTYDNQSRDFLKLYTIGDVSHNSFVRLYDTEQFYQIHLNGKLLAADHYYIAWILSLALADEKIDRVLKKHHISSSELPYFLERSYYSFIYAMRVFDELGGKGKVTDYTLDEQGSVKDFPLSQKLSSNEHHDYWFQPNLNVYLDYLKSRHLALGYSSKSIKEYLEDSNSNVAQAAQEIAKMYDDLVASECLNPFRKCEN